MQGKDERGEGAFMNEQDYIKALEETGNYRVITRFEPTASYHQDVHGGIDKKKAIFLDTETTGMDCETDAIIELAMIPFEYDAEGRIYNLLPIYESFNDPERPIPENITTLTGINNQMVRGQKIDLESVKATLKDVSLIIAHNAQFDRPFCEKLAEEFKNIAWGCSIADIDWKGQGIESAKLEYLAYRHGFFYEGHRASIDCRAGIEILSRKLPMSDKTALKALLDNSKRVDVRLWAENAPFDSKDILKKRGYRWNQTKKTWYIDLPEDKVEAELNKLNTDIYPTKRHHLPMEHFDAKRRYSRTMRTMPLAMM